MWFCASKENTLKEVPTSFGTPTSAIKISVLVDKKDADRAVQAVHDKFFAF